jgi:hypothetical protein
MSAEMIGLVLDDQDVGGQFGVDVGLGLGDQPFDVHRVGVEDLGRLRGRETFEGGQQEGLARTRSDLHQALRGVVATLNAAFVFQLGAGRGPDGVEDVIQGDARRHLRRQLAFAGGQRLKGHPHIVVASSLIAGQRASVAAHVRKMRRETGQQAHELFPDKRNAVPLNWNLGRSGQRIKSVTVPARRTKLEH